MKKLFLLLMVAGALIIGAMNYHFILLDEGMRVLRKAEWSFEDTFIDARGVQKGKLLFKPSLLKAGIKDILNSK